MERLEAFILGLSVISRKWSMEIDLFASEWNAQTRIFVSWLPQPGACATNALSISWTELNGYTYPLFTSERLSVENQPGSGVLVCQYWPSQPWFPSLLELACGVPILFNPREDLLTSASTCYETMAFRSKLSMPLSPVLVHPLSLHTSPPGNLGRIGALDSVTIPCQAG